MNKTQAVIKNIDQKPFVSFEQAATIRDLLMGESIHQYQVELFEEGNESAGFVVIRQSEGQENLATQKVIYEWKDDPSMSSDKEKNEYFTSQSVNKVYHPALRTYFLYIPLAMVGIVLVLFAVELWMFVLSLLGLSGLPGWIDGLLLISVTQVMGGAWLVWLLSGVLLNYYGTALFIDGRGLTFKKGIITRDVTNVRFDEIRTIGLRQGIFDRLLNIGTLEFASSGTDDVDIRFTNMANPTGVKAEIEDIIERYRH